MYYSRSAAAEASRRRILRAMQHWPAESYRSVPRVGWDVRSHLPVFPDSIEMLPPTSEILCPPVTENWLP